ncbi:UNVERIFIED_CONTAM: RND family efflux transporter MFP subunit [Acetivibrio alkalicellulosi]
MKKSILLLLMAGIIIIAAGCSSTASTSESNEERAISVSVSNVQKNSLEKTQNITGQAKPSKEINVIAQLPGKVSQVNVRLGDQVNKGQVIFTIDDKDIRLQLAQAEAALNVARVNVQRAEGGALELQMAQLESSLKSAEINLNDAQKMYEDTKTLYENGMVSKQNLDGVQTRYELAKEQFQTARTAKELTEARINKENLEASRAQLRQAEAAYNVAKSQLENTIVTSPVDGYISMLNVNAGELVSSAMPAATVVEISEIFVDINVVENIVNQLKVGDKYNVYIRSVQQEPFIGEIMSVSPNADPRTQSYLTRLKVSNENKLIKGGMAAQVEIVTYATDEVLTVPIESVVNQNGRNYIYIVEEDKALRKEVTTGASNDSLMEIMGDVKDGDRVVVRGQNFLKDNSKVTVIESQQEME